MRSACTCNRVVPFKSKSNVSVESNGGVTRHIEPMIHTAKARERNECGRSVLAGQGSPKLRHPTKPLLPPKAE